MKKSLLSLVALIGLVLGFTGCEKESLGKTSITYYAEITLEGEETMVVAKGSTFVEPGFKAVMAGKDVSDQVQVSSNVDTSKSGIYTISYSVVNPDGFVATNNRTVIVLDLSDAVEGFWRVDMAASFRVFNGATSGYKGAFEFLIIKRADGYYDVEDLMAGWYAQGAGYGDNYAMKAVVDIAGDGTITLLASKVAGWGDSADFLNDGKYDAATSTITYTLGYGRPDNEIDFHVTLNKVVL